MSHPRLNETASRREFQKRPGFQGMPNPQPETSEGQAIAKLKAQIVLAYDRAPVKYRVNISPRTVTVMSCTWGLTLVT